MDQTKRAALAALLEERARQVADLEARAADAIHQDQDQISYEELMRQKAELLSGLAAEAEPLLEGADKQEAATIKGFSMSADMSLNIGSVFFMSALLYPENHRHGEPNNLEMLVRTFVQG